MKLLGEAWSNLLGEEVEKPYFKQLMETLKGEYKQYLVYPHPSNVFKAFELCPPERVKVVIISQDPYPHEAAHGLAFSSQISGPPPKSLMVILRELDRSLWRTRSREEYRQYVSSNNLSCWAQQGVFLLNSVLTVRAGVPESHANIGWQQFTTKAIELLALDKRPKAFVAWGEYAKKLVHEVSKQLDNTYNHTLLTAGHPASGSHGKDLFSGNNHFIKINKFLRETNQEEIDWKVV